MGQSSVVVPWPWTTQSEFQDELTSLWQSPRAAPVPIESRSPATSISPSPSFVNRSVAPPSVGRFTSVRAKAGFTRR